MRSRHLVAPSVLSADFAHLYDDIEIVNNSVADWFHVDIMDGVFVPNISFGFPILTAIARYAKKPLDVHLMIIDPDRYIQQFSEMGATNITVHIEACTHLHRTIQTIKEHGCNAGVAINPHTPISLLQEIVSDIDLVCIMSVNPGFGGQQFIENTYQKIRTLRQLAQQANHENLLIEVDGGVSENNASALINSGADVLVAGSSIFGASDPTAAITSLKNSSSDTISI